MKRLILAAFALALITNGCAFKRPKPTIYQVGPEVFQNISSGAKIAWMTMTPGPDKILKTITVSPCPETPIPGVFCEEQPVYNFSQVQTPELLNEVLRKNMVKGGYAMTIKEGARSVEKIGVTGIVDGIAQAGLTTASLLVGGVAGNVAGSLLVYGTGPLNMAVMSTTSIPEPKANLYYLRFASGKIATAICTREDNQIPGKCRDKMLKALKDRALQIQPAESPS